MWRILHKRLPVRDALFKRGVNCLPLCCLFDQHNETIDIIYSWIVNGSTMGVTFSTNNEAPLVLATSYSWIWKVRNKRCFEGVDIPNAITVCNRAVKAIHEFNLSDGLLQQVITQPNFGTSI